MRPLAAALRSTVVDVQDLIFVAASNASSEAAGSTVLASKCAIPDGSAAVIRVIAWALAAIDNAILRIQQVFKKCRVAAGKSSGVVGIGDPNTSCVYALLSKPTRVDVAAPFEALNSRALDIIPKIEAKFTILDVNNTIASVVIDVTGLVTKAGTTTLALALASATGTKVSRLEESIRSVLVDLAATNLVGLEGDGGGGKGSEEEGSGELHVSWI